VLATSATTGIGTPAPASAAANTTPMVKTAPRHRTAPARQPDVKKPAFPFMTAVFPVYPAAAAELHEDHAPLCRRRL
jgi:hypothetical protein